MKKLLFLLLIAPLFIISSCEDNNGGNSNLEIGDASQGGLVFYIDQTGEHGLVAAMEDLEGIYQWGCYPHEVNGADGTSIGSGYQNTMDIVTQGCATQDGSIIAAQAALDAEINGYSDWYLPSINELREMYNTIGNGGSEGNIGGFRNEYYWSSSEFNNYAARNVYFYLGHPDYSIKYGTGRVRVIRAF